MTERRTTGAGRRAATGPRHRVDATVLAAVLVPLLSFGALLLVDERDDVDTPSAAPDETALAATDLGCPSGLDGDGVAVAGRRITVGSAGAGPATAEGGGTVLLDVVGAGSRPLRLVDGPVRARTGGRAAVVRGRGGRAPGLLAARLGGPGATGAAVACPAPAPDRWFTAAGAGATHSSVLELVNPDAGPAVADVTVLGRTGVADVPALRGVTVPGGEAARLDLARIAPGRDDLALRVVVSRGRLAATLLDRIDRLGGDAPRQDWLAPQDEPRTRQSLPGLLAGAGSRSLVLANPGDDEARVTVSVVTAQSTLRPVGLETATVAPGSVTVVELGSLLRREVRRGALALRVDASVPVTATLRQLVDDDLAHAVPAPPLDRAAALVPPGDARVVLAGAAAPGTVVLRPVTEEGRALSPLRRELDPDRAVEVALPAGAARVDVEVRGTTASGALVVTSSGGATVSPLRPLVERGLVPQVRPGLP